MSEHEDNDDTNAGQTREVFESCYKKSKVLGPDGKRLSYAKQKLGFDLTPRAKNSTNRQ
jgi:hypothetical protein